MVVSIAWSIQEYRTCRTKKGTAQSNNQDPNENKIPNGWIPAWTNPIWQLPFFQLANYARFAHDIAQIVAERQNCIDDLTCLERLRFLGEGLVDPLKKYCGEKNLHFVTARQSRVEGNYLRARMIEAIFESGPQFIVQLSIVLKTGAIEYHQLASMAISLASFWWTTCQILMAMPSSKTAIRTASIRDYAVLFLPTMFVTMVRLTAWSFLLAFLDLYILLPFVATVLIPAYILKKDIQFSNESDLIDLVVTAFVPCIVKDEYSMLYMKTTITTTIPIMVSLLLTLVIHPGIHDQPPVMKCFDNNDQGDFHNCNSRCWYNREQESLTHVCTASPFLFGANSYTFGGVPKQVKDFRTICQPGDNVIYLIYLGCLVALEGALVVSMTMACYWIDPYLDPFSRFKKSGQRSWNGFFRTQREDLVELMSPTKSITKQESRQLFLSAVQDNIESLVKHMLDHHQIDMDNDLTKQASDIAKANGNQELLMILNGLNSSAGQESSTDDSIELAEVGDQGQQEEEDKSWTDIVDNDNLPRLGLYEFKLTIKSRHDRIVSLDPTLSNPIHSLIIANDLDNLERVLNYHRQLSRTWSGLSKRPGIDNADTTLEDAVMDIFAPENQQEIISSNNRMADFLIKQHRTFCNSLVTDTASHDVTTPPATQVHIY